MRATNEDFQLIDIREAYETESVQIGGQVIPMDQVLERSSELRKDCKVIFLCRTGENEPRPSSTLSNVRKEWKTFTASLVVFSDT